MATKYPGATWRPIGVNFTKRRRSRTGAIVLHVTASTAASQFGWFSNPRSGASCHLHIALDGTIEQYVDLDQIAWTSGGGNWRTIGIETAGTGTGEWTIAQCVAIVEVLAWLCRRYDVPVVLMDSSHPDAVGIGWHRLGIDGNFPPLPDIRAGRVQRGGGELWSGARGKVCPGDGRILQIPALVERVHDRLNPALEEDDDMLLIRRLGAKKKNRRYALVSGGRAKELRRKSYTRLKKRTGQVATQLVTADYDEIVRDWK